MFSKLQKSLDDYLIIFRANLVSKQFKIACYVMIALILMQSGFAMAESFTANIDSKHTLIQSFQVDNTSTKIPSGDKSTSEEVMTQDECLDCNSTCCPCCPTLLLTFAKVKNEAKIEGFHFYSIEPLRLETLYYSFLRPPIV